MSEDRSASEDRPVSERRPASVYGVGSDPDPRFSLANERTALAWVRTGISLVAGGIALTSVASIAELPELFDVVAAVACFLGGAVALSALSSWRATERAIRTGAPLPSPRALPLLVGAVVVLALVLGGFAVVQVLWAS